MVELKNIAAYVFAEQMVVNCVPIIAMQNSGCMLLIRYLQEQGLQDPPFAIQTTTLCFPTEKDALRWKKNMLVSGACDCETPVPGLAASPRLI